MKFAVVGGDRRAAILCALLARDGHKVYTYAMEKAELPAEIPRAGCLQGCVYRADCVVLPIPAEKSGILNAPYGAQTYPMEEIIAALWPGQIICGGKFSEESRRRGLTGGLKLTDLMRRESFATGNAAVTAEGAVECLTSLSERTLWKSRVLVTGWGRIAKILVLRLHAMGAEVVVAARSPADRVQAEAFGCAAVDFKGMEPLLGGFDFVVNTVPARIFDGAQLCAMSEETVLLELASPPGGFDGSMAENLGLRAAAAPGLPGRFAPYTAAELLRDEIYEIITEQED